MGVLGWAPQAEAPVVGLMAGVQVHRVPEPQGASGGPHRAQRGSRSQPGLQVEP